MLFDYILKNNYLLLSGFWLRDENAGQCSRKISSVRRELTWTLEVSGTRQIKFSLNSYRANSSKFSQSRKVIVEWLDWGRWSTSTRICLFQKRPRSKLKGRWNIVYIRDGLSFRIRHELNNDANECLWFEIVRQKCELIFICSVYKAPDADLESFVSFLGDYFLKLDYSNSDLVLLGDFNVDFTPCKGKHNAAKHKLLNFTRTLELSQLVKELTRVTDTSRATIGLIFVNRMNTARFVSRRWHFSANNRDHYLVYCILKVGIPNDPQRCRSYKKYNRDDFFYWSEWRPLAFSWTILMMQF